MMGVYTRFKKDPSGFRALVELIESTPAVRRKKMIDVGMAEDPAYTETVLQYVYRFEDVIALPDEELAELMEFAPPRLLGTAIRPLPPEVRQKFLRNAKPPVATEVREYIDIEASLQETGGAQLRVVGYLRKLERQGRIRTKRIPESGIG